MVSFFLKAEEFFIVCIHHVLFIHSSAEGYLWCFHLWAILKDAAVQVWVGVPIFNSFGDLPRSGAAGSSGDSAELFEELADGCPQQLHHFKCQPPVHQGANLPTCYFLVLSFLKYLSRWV